MLVDAAVDAVAAQALGELPDAVHVLLAVVAVADEDARRHARRMIAQVGRRANGKEGGAAAPCDFHSPRVRFRSKWQAGSSVSVRTLSSLKVSVL